jgi:hypothetical protein
MSGTFHRKAYDTGTYAATLEQSTAPLGYILDPTSINVCKPCRPTQPGYLGKVGVSITHQRALVDVESDLLRLQEHASRDPSKRYHPSCDMCGSQLKAGSTTCKNCQGRLFDFPECDTMTEYCRLTNPICTSREVGINRFQPLLLNPQDENRWLQPSEVGINYRMVVKDNYTPCPKAFKMY